MTNITNIARDSSFVDMNATKINYAPNTTLNDTSFNVDANATVQSDYAFQNGQVLARTILADNAIAYGVYMKPPQYDLTPFRVKAYGSAAASGHVFMLGIGYAPATITGEDDVIEKPQYFPFYGADHFDDIIMLPALPSTDPYFNRPICFAIVIIDTATVGATQLITHLSVQNVSVAPPPFAASSA